MMLYLSFSYIMYIREHIKLNSLQETFRPRGKPFNTTDKELLCFLYNNHIDFERNIGGNSIKSKLNNWITIPELRI